MPTGYTSDIKNGITFEKFVMGCARGFGACVTMRDDDTDTPIPKEFKSSTYHEEKIKETVKETEIVNKMNVQEAEGRARKEWLKEKKSNEKYIKEKKKLKEKYEDMLQKVKQWTPPSKDHIELKKFMIDQIETSIAYDCNLDYYLKKNLKPVTGEQWLKNKRKSLEEDLKYHIKEYKAEKERINGRNKWIKELRESLEGKV